MVASGKLWFKSALAALFLVCLLAGRARANEDYSLWSQSGDLFLNTTPDGANVSGTVTRIPLLIRLTGSTFDFRQARKDGRDIRFANSAGKHLPYQVERWDSAKAVAEIWVLADEVKGNSDDQFLRMHWGRPTAPDSSRGGAVFDSSNGYMGAWHLGPGIGNRPNSVSWGQAAVPVNYNGAPAVPGIIGFCDSLDNRAGQEDHLQLHDDYSDFARGFTFSVWAYPTAVTTFGRLMDLGNGPGLDNIWLGRIGTSEDMAFEVYAGGTKAVVVTMSGALKLNEWQHYAVTVDGTQVRIYRNGVPIDMDSMSRPMPAVRRAYQYFGRSNWTQDHHFQGKLDEPTLGKKARSADFIKLSYANQRPDQKLVSFVRTFACASRYIAPRDTTVPEGRLLEISATADCATGYSWTGMSSLCPRILDPAVKTLQAYLPRVARDEVLVYRFVARFGDSVRTKDVRVTVKESIPDPVWSFPNLPPWSGRDSLAVKPAISNLSAVKASRDSVMRWAWSVNGVQADTAWRKDQLVLRRPSSSGRITVGLCLDNGGPVSCKQVNVDVNLATAGIPPLGGAEAGVLPKAEPFRDAAGRRREAGRPPVLPFRY